MDTSAMKARWWAWPRWIPLGLIAAGFVAYHNSFTGPLIFDDENAITENPFVRRIWPLWSAMSAPPQTTVAGRPVVSLTLAINYAISGLHVWSYHLFNLVIHLLNALLLWGIVRRTLQSERLRDRFAGIAEGLAFATAMIWMLHPLQTEAVDYIVQRTELLMAMFFLLTIYCFLRSLDAPCPPRWQSAAVVACALGMGCKEVMVSAPLMVLLYDRIFFADSFRQLLRQRWKLYVGLAFTWLILLSLVATGPRSASAGFGFQHLNSWDYAKTQGGIIFHYLRLCFWPQPLVIDYDDWPIAKELGPALPSLMGVAAMLAVTLWLLMRRPAWGFLGLWFFIILAPTSSVVPIATEIVAERRVYLALAAVVILTVVAAHEALEFLLRRFATPEHFRCWIKIGVLTLTACVCGIATIHRNEDYRTVIAIWSDAVAKRPRNARAHNNLGAAFLRQNQLEEALKHLNEAIRLNHLYTTAYKNRGEVWAKKGQFPKAIADYQKALRLEPNDADVHLNFGVALAAQNRYEEAIRQYGEALRSDPNSGEAYYNLGIAFTHLGRLAEATNHYRQALRINPDDAMAHYNLANALAEQGKLPEAVTEYSQAIRLQPDDAWAHNNLGSAFLRGGQFEAAITQFSEAIRYQPDLAEAYANWAMALGAQGKSQEALAQYRRALGIAQSLKQETLAQQIAAQIETLRGTAPPPAPPGKRD